MKSPINHKSSLAVLALLGIAVTFPATSASAGWIPFTGHKHKAAAPAAQADGELAPQTAPMQASGPAADFPVVLGAPYAVGDTTYAPADAMNYDGVGYAAIGGGDGSFVSAAHHTLPLPSYIEVTSLESGRTILVRVDQRGPMDSNRLVQLSPGAAAQLGIGDNAAVRVRRVNPPEIERAALRSGNPVPERMSTPKALLAVLVRKLNPGTALAVNTDSAAPAPMAGPSAKSVYGMAPAPAVHAAPVHVRVAMAPHAPATGASFAGAFAKAPAPVAHDVAEADPAPRAMPRHAVKPRAMPVAAPAPEEAEDSAPVSASRDSSFVIQAGAFAMKARASEIATKIGGKVSNAGHIWRVRKGPFDTRGAAEAALVKVKSAGYSDARIQHAD